MKKTSGHGWKVIQFFYDTMLTFKKTKREKKEKHAFLLTKNGLGWWRKATHNSEYMNTQSSFWWPLNGGDILF